MTCGAGFPIIFTQTSEEKIEVMLWIAGKGPQTPAVMRAIERTGLTFGIALITRGRFGHDGTFRRN